MIEAKDLRIGNWFNYEDEPMQWEMDDFRNMEFDSVDCIWQPIPLTEEWLVKFGFEKDGDTPFFRSTIFNRIYIDTSHFSFFFCNRHGVLNAIGSPDRGDLGKGLGASG